ncbi:hypothetical protein MaudCBS49596_002248 [Microsporum audouinii]
MPVEYGLYNDPDWDPEEGSCQEAGAQHPPASQLALEDLDKKSEGGSPEPASMVAWEEESQRPMSEALVESNRREAELSELSERLHSVDIFVRLTVTDLGTLYIRNMLLEIIKKLFLVEGDMSIYRLRDLAETVTYEELDNFPVPAEYWYPIRHVAVYIAEDESPLYDTSLYFAVLLTQPENRWLRARWSTAFVLAYGRTIYDVTGARPENMLV